MVTGSALPPGRAWQESTDRVARWVLQAAERPVTRALFVSALLAFAVASRQRYNPPLDASVASVLAVLGCALLMSVARFPTVSLVLVLGANASFVLFGRLSWPWPDVVAWLVAVALCPIVLDRRRALALVLGTELAVLGAVFVSDHVNATPWDASVSESLAVLLAFLIGDSLRARRVRSAREAAAAVAVRVLQERDAVARERVSIARDLHDVVAHHVSLIAVRAATAQYAVADLSPAARTAFDEIAEQARTALNELRGVLGVLRADTGGAGQVPQPTLADLPALLDQLRATGAEVRLSGPPSPPRLPEAVELCAFRVLQEAVTNAARHAAGQPVDIELAYPVGRLEARVTNPLGPARGNDRPGFGLIGMRERVAAVGGRMTVGEDDGDRFQVSITLPVGGE